MLSKDVNYIHRAIICHTLSYRLPRPLIVHKKPVRKNLTNAILTESFRSKNTNKLNAQMLFFENVNVIVWHHILNVCTVELPCTPPCYLKNGQQYQY